jgi:Tfp pilus assembly protein PilX
MACKRRSRSSNRVGAILAIVLVSLFVAALMGLSLVELVLMHHRQQTRFAQQEQCLWLAESGVGRAQMRLARSPEYRGETWTVPGEVFGAARPGVVTIEVTSVRQPHAGRQIRVEATYPDDPMRRIVIERTHFLQLPSPGGTP